MVESCFWKVFQPFNRQPPEISRNPRLYQIIWYIWWKESNPNSLFRTQGFCSFLKRDEWTDLAPFLAQQLPFLSYKVPKFRFGGKWPFYMRKIRLRKSSLGEDLAWRLPKLLKPHITAKSANLWVLVGFQHRLDEHLKTDFWDILIFQSSKNTYLTCTCIFIMF